MKKTLFVTLAIAVAAIAGFSAFESASDVFVYSQTASDVFVYSISL